MTSLPKIATEWRRFEDLSTEALYELLQFRQNIFVVEQRSVYPDLDGLDQGAWHLLLRVESELRGYLRLLPVAASQPSVRIGRVAVAPSLRRRGLGRVLMDEALRLHSRGYTGQEIVLSAQAHLAAFYAAFGFEAISAPYDEFGIPHIDMKLRASI
ncbi:MAG: GNAT family N-acetyltransferase [Stellaceae bacterium]